MTTNAGIRWHDGEESLEGVEAPCGRADPHDRETVSVFRSVLFRGHGVPSHHSRRFRSGSPERRREALAVPAAKHLPAQPTDRSVG